MIDANIATGSVPKPTVASHVYSLCFFERGLVVPTVILVEAETDEEAVAIARDMRLYTTRQVWERHRLVAVIPAAY